MLTWSGPGSRLDGEPVDPEDLPALQAGALPAFDQDLGETPEITKGQEDMRELLDGQVAIVTGAARGIGYGIAERLAAEGAKVIVWDRDLSPLDSSGSRFSPAAAEIVDVADYSSVERAFSAAVEAFGKVDILVNNAGVNGPVAPAWEYSLEDWDRVVAIDMTGVFYCCRVAARHMRERGYGRIITVASIAGKEGVPYIAAYSAAKAGVIGFSKALAKELCDAGVTVNCIAPALTETELMREMTEDHIERMRAKIPMGRFVKIEEIAAMCAFVASPDCSFTTGFVFDVTGGRATY